MAYVERTDLRQSHSLTLEDEADPGKRRFVAVLRPIHYHDGAQFQRVDLTPQRINNAQADGWLVTENNFRYFLGRDIGNHGNEDGWFAFGTRDAAHWVKSRLMHVGYLHQQPGTPVLASDFVHIDAANKTPTWTRAGNLALNISTSDVGGVQINEVANVRWADLWPALPQGQLDMTWQVDGRYLKSNLELSQDGWSWIRANRPNATPDNETYFGFVFQMDWSTVPKILLRGVQKLSSENYDDSALTAGEYLALRDATDGLIAALPIDYLWSSANPNKRLRLRKRFWRDNDGNTYLAIGALVSDILTLPAGDLVFDPTYDQQPDATAGVDALLVKNDPTTNYGTYLGLETGRDGNNTERHSLILFDLSSIPAAATCDDSTLTLYNHTSSNNTTNQCTVYHMTQAWGEATCTWNTYDGTNSWPGGAGADGDKGNALGTFNPLGASTPGYIAITLSTTETATKFGGNLDMYIREDAEQAFRKAGYYSSDHTTASQRPQLVINYTTSYLIGAATIAVSAAAIAAVTKGIAGTSTIALSTTGVLDLIKSLVGPVTISIDSTGALTVDGTVLLVGAVTITIDATGVLGNTKNLLGSTPITLSATAAAALVKNLIGPSTIAVASVGAASVTKPLVGSTTLAMTSTGVLDLVKSLVGPVTIALTSTGDLTIIGDVLLAGTVTISIDATSVLDVAKGLIGAAPITLSATGAASLIKSLTLSSPVLITVSPVGVLSLTKPLAGVSPIDFVSTGVLDLVKSFTGPVSIDFAPAGVLTVTGAGLLVGTVSIAFTAAGVVSLAKGLAGSTTLSLSTTALLSLIATLQGTTDLSLSATGVLSTGAGVFLVGESTIGLTAVGDASITKPLSGPASISVSNTGLITLTKPLVGSSTIQFQVVGAIFNAEGMVEIFVVPYVPDPTVSPAIPDPTVTPAVPDATIEVH